MMPEEPHPEGVRISLKNESHKIAWSGVKFGGWVLTSAQIFLENINDFIQDYDSTSYHYKGNIQQTLLGQFKVLIYSTENVNSKKKVQVGNIQYLWKSSKVEEDLKVFYERWPSINQDSKYSTNDKSLFGACFMLIKMDSSPNIDNEDPFKFLINLDLRTEKIVSLGEPILIVSTPFGNEHLFNSWASGIISNLFDPNNTLFLTDVRLAPSCEGAPIYRFSKGPHLGKVIALVLQPVVKKTGESVGYTLCISLAEIVDSFINLTNHSVDILNDNMRNFCANEVKTVQPRLLKNKDPFKYIVLISFKSCWSSGIIVGDGLILTCAHCVHFGKIDSGDEINVTIGEKVLTANLIYCTSAASKTDVALLALKTDHHFEKVKLATKLPEVGSNVIAVGYSLMISKWPNVSSGIVSKLHCHLHTTCIVHSGMSGGAILDCEGSLIGLIQCNTVAVYTYPELNISLPITVIGPSLISYIETRDVSSLHVWEQGGSLSCKL